MRLVLLGPPGAGKGTQAGRIVDAFAVVHVSTGDIFRRNVRDQTALGREAQGYMDRGELVPDEVVIGMVQNRLNEDDARAGFMLDGFPRTVPQAQALGEFLEREARPLDAVVRLNVPEEELVSRLDRRRVVDGRSDDTPEAIHQRLVEYRTKTAPLVAYYAERGLLVDVDGVGDVDDVSQRILKVLHEIDDGRRS